MNPRSLKANPQNARVHTPKQIRQVSASINRFGFTNPILIDEQGAIIAGHARREAAIQLGLDKVPAIRIYGLSEAERSALALADNKLGLNASWNEQILASELKILLDPTLEFNFEIAGFDTVEIDNLLALEVSGPVDDELDVAPATHDAVSARAISQLGDIWKLGPHRVCCGDARDESSYSTLMESSKARMAFLGPPYNVEIDGHVTGLGKKRHREFVMGSGEMSAKEHRDFLSTILRLCAKHCMNGAILFVWMDWRHLAELFDAGRDAALQLKNVIVWVKPIAGMGTFYRSAHELIAVFKSGTGPHVNNFGLGETGRYRTNVWQYPAANSFGRHRDAEMAEHPTPKPVALVADAIRDVSHRNDLVIDCFGGSGTTLIAAHKTGRRARLIELDPLYVDLIVRRWQRYTKSEAIHQSGKTFSEIEIERGT